MRSILGVAAATALPSEVWPFRKIFLPTQPAITIASDYKAYRVGMYLGFMNFGSPNTMFKITGITAEAITFETPARIKAWHVSKGLFT